MWDNLVAQFALDLALNRSRDARNGRLQNAAADRAEAGGEVVQVTFPDVATALHRCCATIIWIGRKLTLPARYRTVQRNAG